jgi:hypothetical protein
MPATTIMSRVKNDFFAILAPGSFILVIIASVSLAFTRIGSSGGIIDRITPFFDVIKGYWPSLFVLFILAYLVGILVRAVRVNLADTISKKLFVKWNKRTWLQLGYKSPFPYPVVLEEIKEQLTESKLVTDFPVPGEKNLHNAYNFWKMAICYESREVFNYIQAQESIVRLFAGMFWAGLIGVIGSIVTLVGCLLNKEIRGVWLEYAIVMLAVSVVILVMFGMNIRRVRAQEVTFVFMAYLVIHHKKEQEEEKNKPKKKNPNPHHVFEYLSKILGKKD